MLSQFTFNRPPLRIDTGGGDADLSRYADHVTIVHLPSTAFTQARPHDAMHLTSYGMTDVQTDIIYIERAAAEMTMWARSGSPQ